MSFQSRETSQYSGKPYELFAFHTEAQIWRLTGADENKAFGGMLYTPTAITHTEPSQGVEIKSGQLKVSIPNNHEIASLFHAYMPTSPLWLTIYRAHDGEDESQTVTYWTGKASVAHFAEFCEITCAPEQDTLKKHIPGAKHQPQCNRALYSPGCGVVREAFRVFGALVSVNAAVIQAPEFASKPDGWFNNGYIEKGTQRRMILGHTGNTLTLITGMAGLSVGDAVIAYAGCDRAYSGDCIAKFSNGAAFFGFPWLPTKNPFGGGLI